MALSSDADATYGTVSLQQGQQASQCGTTAPQAGRAPETQTPHRSLHATVHVLHTVYADIYIWQVRPLYIQFVQLCATARLGSLVDGTQQCYCIYMYRSEGRSPRFSCMHARGVRWVGGCARGCCIARGMWSSTDGSPFSLGTHTVQHVGRSASYVAWIITCRPFFNVHTLFPDKNNYVNINAHAHFTSCG